MKNWYQQKYICENRKETGHDIKVVLGDFNAKVGQEWKWVAINWFRYYLAIPTPTIYIDDANDAIRYPYTVSFTLSDIQIGTIRFF